MAKRIQLTKREIECLRAAARNIDPCMWDENPGASEREKVLDRAAWESGIAKLEAMLDRYDDRELRKEAAAFDAGIPEALEQLERLRTRGR